MKKGIFTLMVASAISTGLMLAAIPDASARKLSNQQANSDKWGNGWNVKQTATPGYDIHQWISKHIKYTQDAKANKVDGKIVLKILLDNKGKVTDAQVIGDKIGFGLDELVVAAVKKMPRFKKPAFDDNGKAVASFYRVPITYNLLDK